MRRCRMGTLCGSPRSTGLQRLFHDRSGCGAAAGSAVPLRGVDFKTVFEGSSFGGDHVVMTGGVHSVIAIEVITILDINIVAGSPEVL
jgi:hypothetical protein